MTSKRSDGDNERGVRIDVGKRVRVRSRMREQEVRRNGGGEDMKQRRERAIANFVFRICLPGERYLEVERELALFLSYFRLCGCRVLTLLPHQPWIVALWPLYQVVVCAALSSSVQQQRRRGRVYISAQEGEVEKGIQSSSKEPTLSNRSSIKLWR